MQYYLFMEDSTAFFAIFPCDYGGISYQISSFHDDLGRKLSAIWRRKKYLEVISRFYMKNMVNSYD